MFFGELREEYRNLTRHELTGTHLFVAVSHFDLPRRHLSTHLAPCHPTCHGASRRVDDAGSWFLMRSRKISAPPLVTQR
jgi:hypothetical protein